MKPFTAPWEMLCYAVVFRDLSTSAQCIACKTARTQQEKGEARKVEKAHTAAGRMCYE
jgi:hypothetical protein